MTMAALNAACKTLEALMQVQSLQSNVSVAVHRKVSLRKVRFSCNIAQSSSDHAVVAASSPGHAISLCAAALYLPAAICTSKRCNLFEHCLHQYTHC